MHAMSKYLAVPRKHHLHMAGMRKLLHAMILRSLTCTRLNCSAFAGGGKAHTCEREQSSIVPVQSASTLHHRACEMNLTNFSAMSAKASSPAVSIRNSSWDGMVLNEIEERNLRWEHASIQGLSVQCSNEGVSE